jgi:hypothetical protein
LDGSAWAAIVGIIGGMIVTFRHKAIVRQANSKTTPGAGGVLPIRTQELVVLFVGLVMLAGGLAFGVALLASR